MIWVWVSDVLSNYTCAPCMRIRTATHRFLCALPFCHTQTHLVTTWDHITHDAYKVNAAKKLAHVRLVPPAYIYACVRAQGKLEETEFPVTEGR